MFRKDRNAREQEKLLRSLGMDLQTIKEDDDRIRSENRKQIEEILEWGKFRKWAKNAD